MLYNLKKCCLSGSLTAAGQDRPEVQSWTGQGGRDGQTMGAGQDRAEVQGWAGQGCRAGRVGKLSTA